MSAAPPLVAPAPETWAWRSGACAALGHRFEVLVSEPGHRALFEPLVAAFRAPYDGHAALRRYLVWCDDARSLPWTLACDDEELASGRWPGDLTSALAWHVNRSVIDSSVDHHVLLHAAAVTRGGITVALPADMEHGKTTTVAGLLRTGYDYVTDEAVALDPETGWVTSFPKTLSLDPGSWPLFPECRREHPPWRLRQWHVTPASLGARQSDARVPPPRVVVFPRYVRGADTVATQLSAGTAVRDLARMTFGFAREPVRNLATLTRLATNASCYRLVIGSLDDAVRTIDDLISRRILEDL